MKKLVAFAILPALLVLIIAGFNGRKAAAWKIVTASNEPARRHENAFMKAGDKFYLFGGRKKQSVDQYDPKTNSWKPVAETPSEMHHFQAVEYKGEIYVLGAFMGDFPHETPVPKIYIYNAAKDQWREGAEIPENRRRGAAGAIAYKDKIYMVCGIIDGHYDGHVTWMDEFDPLPANGAPYPTPPMPATIFRWPWPAISWW